MNNHRKSWLRAALTDIQLWVPLAVLVLGLIVLQAVR